MHFPWWCSKKKQIEHILIPSPGPSFLYKLLHQLPQLSREKNTKKSHTNTWQLWSSHSSSMPRRPRLPAAWLGFDKNLWKKTTPITSMGLVYFWAIYYKSLTWIKVILGRIPLLFTTFWGDLGWGCYKLPRYLSTFCWFFMVTWCKCIGS